MAEFADRRAPPELAEVPYLEAKRFYHQKLGIGLAIIAVGA